MTTSPPRLGSVPGSGHNGLVGTLLGRLVAWIREGYPTGVPERDYVPLMALLRRRLTDKEVKQVSRALVRSRTLPADAIDIGVGITKVTDDMPSPADVQRVRRRLKKKGWPTDFPARAKPVRRAGQATAKADTSGADEAKAAKPNTGRPGPDAPRFSGRRSGRRAR